MSSDTGTFNIETKGLIELTQKLESLHRSDLPVSVNQTLNWAAFDMKQNQIIRSSKRFTNRKKAFFKANSSVDKAMGFDVSKMVARVGFANKKEGTKPQFIQDLYRQEWGGRIKGRSFIPLTNARTSKQKNKPVAKRNQLKVNKRTNRFKVIKAADSKGKTRADRFRAAAIYARGRYGNEAMVIYRGRVYRIDYARTNVKKRTLQIKATPIYSYKKSRSVNIRATHFVEKALTMTRRQMEQKFVELAKKRIDKRLSR